MELFLVGVSPLPEALTPSRLSWSLIINYHLNVTSCILELGSSFHCRILIYAVPTIWNSFSFLHLSFIQQIFIIQLPCVGWWVTVWKAVSIQCLKKKKKQVSSHPFLVYSLEYLGSDCNQVITQEHHTATLILQRTRQLWLTFFD